MLLSEYGYDSMDAATAAAVGGSMVGSVIGGLIAGILLIIAWWKLFQKAGIPGWHSIIPFLNTYDMFKMSWGNGWLFLLLLIPFVGGIVALITQWKLGAAFGKGVGFRLGLIFLPNIFLLILGFGSAQYEGNA